MPLLDAAGALLARMTLDEKIGQLNLLAAGEGLATGAAGETQLGARLDAGSVGAIFGTKSLASARAMQERALAGSRLGIPLFFAEDVIHGHRTVFPLPIALACSWNMDLVEETAAFAAAEAASEGLHQVYAPMVDVARDPRWGRVAESPGEDPLLASRYAAAMTHGFQGRDPASPGRVAACLKHFVAYGATQSGRDYDNASLAWEDLFEVYLPPFAAGIAAGAVSVMAAFNAVNKLPMHAHGPLIEGWLRGAAGFGGLVVSDYTGVQELTAHGLGTPAEVVARALHAGIDMDMVGEDFLRELPALAKGGITSAECGLSLAPGEVERLIDRACLRVLSFKAWLGLLDDPFRGLDGRQPAPDRKLGHALARKAAAESAVLLKNAGVLPLAPKGRIALIGPLVEDRLNMIGTWSVSGDARNIVTLRDAIAARPDVTLTTSRGADIVDLPWFAQRLNVHGETVTRDPRGSEAMLAEAVAAARAAEIAIVAIGEAREQAGESSSVLAPEIPASQRRLVAALAETGTPLVVLVFAGRPLALGPIADQADALIYAWHGGIAGPEGVADLVFGDAEPSGRLSVSLPLHPGEVPLHYSVEPTGRPFPGQFAKFRTGWLDLDDALLPRPFPFGFGIGYSAVRYAPPQVSSRVAQGEDGRIELLVAVSNTGDRQTVETVQLYISDPVARITRPGRLLKDFRRIALAPGETREVTFEITVGMLTYPIAPALDSVTEVWDPGCFQLHVGPNSRDTQTVEITWQA
ncbi:MAG: glycoside hydrolase family 3 C-terminal domain-containing protein [Rhodobacteraceae bacterium]|nr:glycoside hydrolase family 3 C-terminal domain-containing protein [Paracoccaceae bacterium]